VCVCVCVRVRVRVCVCRTNAVRCGGGLLIGENRLVLFEAKTNQ